MNDKLIAGYASYTTADEFGASRGGDAPATFVATAVSAVLATVVTVSLEVLC